MGIFYNPPQPPVGSNAVTPPEPHVPLATPGNQPPLRQTGAVLAMVAVLASWPADLEPRLGKPNERQQKIAPLTLTYGQQPPKFSITTRMETVLSVWPLDLEPRLGPPNNQQQKIAPLTLTYGNQPPRFSIATRMETTLASWPLDLEPRLGRPNDQRQKIVPLTLVYGSQPVPRSIATELAKAVASWVPQDVRTQGPLSSAATIPAIVTFLPYTPQPYVIVAANQLPVVQPPTPVKIAPLTLPTGDQPPPRPLLPPLLQTVAMWPVDVGSIDPWPDRTVVKIAPLTLTYGDQPPGLSPAIPDGWGSWISDPPLSQGPPKSVATISTSTFVPFTRLPSSLFWPPDDPPRQRIPIVVTPSGVDQPAGVRPILPVAVTSWIADAPFVQGPSRSIATLQVVSFVPYVRAPMSLFWPPEDPPRPQRAVVTPATTTLFPGLLLLGVGLG